MPLEPPNLITGPNGSGKSNMYRALRLLADAARGAVIASLAREGGFSSALWAGPESFSAAVKRGERPVQGTMRHEPVAHRALDFSPMSSVTRLISGSPCRANRHSDEIL